MPVNIFMLKDRYTDTNAIQDDNFFESTSIIIDIFITMYSNTFLVYRFFRFYVYSLYVHYVLKFL